MRPLEHFNDDEYRLIFDQLGEAGQLKLLIHWPDALERVEREVIEISDEVYARALVATATTQDTSPAAFAKLLQLPQKVFLISEELLFEYILRFGNPDIIRELDKHVLSEVSLDEFAKILIVCGGSVCFDLYQHSPEFRHRLHTEHKEMSAALFKVLCYAMYEGFIDIVMDIIKTYDLSSTARRELIFHSLVQSASPKMIQSVVALDIQINGPPDTPGDDGIVGTKLAKVAVDRIHAVAFLLRDHVRTVYRSQIMAMFRILPTVSNYDHETRMRVWLIALQAQTDIIADTEFLGSVCASICKTGSNDLLLLFQNIYHANVQHAILHGSHIMCASNPKYQCMQTMMTNFGLREYMLRHACEFVVLLHRARNLNAHNILHEYAIPFRLLETEYYAWRETDPPLVGEEEDFLRRSQRYFRVALSENNRKREEINICLNASPFESDTRIILGHIFGAGYV